MMYGWNRESPSADDYIYAANLAEMKTSADYRSDLPPAYTQGTNGSCVAQAVAAMIQYNEKKQNLPNITPSRLFLYYNSRLIQHTTDTDNGTSMKLGIRSVVDYGYCQESYWTYDTTQTLVRPPKIAYRYAGTHKITQFGQVEQNLDQLRGILSSGNLFCFGFTAYTSYESDDVTNTGILNLPADDEVALGGHGVLCCGFDDSTSTFIVRNSLGPSWGMSGYFTMPYEYVTNPNLASDFWTITALPVITDRHTLSIPTLVVTSPSEEFTPTGLPLPTKPIKTEFMPIDPISPNNTIYSTAINTLNPVNLVDKNLPYSVPAPVYPTIFPLDTVNNAPSTATESPNVCEISDPPTVINRVNQPAVDPFNSNKTT